MLGNLVTEQSVSPGNALVINLTGAMAGRSAFRSFLPTGGSTFYVISDEVALWEAGYGTIALGTPDTLSRDTVMSNSSGTAVKLNFTGTVYVYNTIPAGAAIFWNPSGYIDHKSADLRGLASVIGGPVSGFRNRIQNGRFDFWEPGTSFVNHANGQYLAANRWFIGHDGSGVTQTISQQTATDAALLDRGITSYLRWAKTVAGSGQTYRQLHQRIPNARSLSGRNVVLGFMGRADTARTANVILAQHFGSGSSPSGTVNTVLGTVTFTSSWAWVQKSVALPSVAGKSFSGGDDYLDVFFTFPLNVADQYDLADIVLQEGTEVASAMAERRPYEVEASLVHRYYQPFAGSFLIIPYAADKLKVVGQTATPMASTPSMEWSGTGEISLPGIGTFSSSAAPTVEDYDITTGQFRLDWQGFTGMTVSVPGHISDLSGATAALNSEL